MPRLLQNEYFLHDFFGLVIVTEMSRVNGFNRDKLLRNYLQCNIDLTESTFTQYFAHFVEFDCGGGAFLIALTILSDVVHHFEMLAISWRD